MKVSSLFKVMIVGFALQFGSPLFAGSEVKGGDVTIVKGRHKLLDQLEYDSKLQFKPSETSAYKDQIAPKLRTLTQKVPVLATYLEQNLNGLTPRWYYSDVDLQPVDDEGDSFILMSGVETQQIAITDGRTVHVVKEKFEKLEDIDPAAVFMHEAVWSLLGLGLASAPDVRAISSFLLSKYLVEYDTKEIIETLATYNVPKDSPLGKIIQNYGNTAKQSIKTRFDIPQLPGLDHETTESGAPTTIPTSDGGWLTSYFNGAANKLVRGTVLSKLKADETVEWTKTNRLQAATRTLLLDEVPKGNDGKAEFLSFQKMQSLSSKSEHLKVLRYDAAGKLLAQKVINDVYNVNAQALIKIQGIAKTPHGTYLVYGLGKLEGEDFRGAWTLEIAKDLSILGHAQFNHKTAPKEMKLTESSKVNIYGAQIDQDSGTIGMLVSVREGTWADDEVQYGEPPLVPKIYALNVNAKTSEVRSVKSVENGDGTCKSEFSVTASLINNHEVYFSGECLTLEGFSFKINDPKAKSERVTNFQSWFSKVDLFEGKTKFFKFTDFLADGPLIQAITLVSHGTVAVAGKYCFVRRLENAGPCQKLSGENVPVWSALADPETGVFLSEYLDETNFEHYIKDSEQTAIVTELVVSSLAYDFTRDELLIPGRLRVDFGQSEKSDVFVLRRPLSDEN